MRNVESETLSVVTDLATALERRVTSIVARASSSQRDAVEAIVELSQLLNVSDPNALRAALADRKVTVDAPGGLLRLALSDWTSAYMVRSHGWEAPLLEVCRRHISPGQTIVDIGAHVGSYTIFFASLVGSRGRVFAFEPLPTNLAMLRESVELNAIATIVSVEGVALSNSTGTATLFPFANNANGADRYPAPSSMIHSLLRSAGYGEDGVAVPVLTLDAYADAKGLEYVNFIKIDVEGAEGRVLEGGGRLIARSPAITLLVELHPTDLAADGRSVDDVVACLHGYGLVVSDLKVEGGRVRRRDLAVGMRSEGTHLLARKVAT